MPRDIKVFKNQYYFLSNFYPCLVEYEGRTYPSSECAYQAAKSLDPEVRRFFETVSNSMSARRWGNKIQLRPDWDIARYDIMYQILKSKFKIPKLRKMLIDTEDAYLEEGNMHGDKYWGTVKGQGQNNLGKLLMKIRDEIKAGE